MMVGVDQMERRGKNVLGNKLSRCKAQKAEGAGSFGDPGRKPAWLGEVGNGRTGGGAPPPSPRLDSRANTSWKAVIIFSFPG